MKPLSLLVALAAAGLSTTAFGATGPADVAATLGDAGYLEVRDIEFEDGLWEAEVRRANGLWSEVAIDPASGEVFDAMSPRPLVGLEQILASLQEAGYTQVHDVDREGALWDADAIDRDGRRVELRISGYDGRVLDARPDSDH